MNPNISMQIYKIVSEAFDFNDDDINNTNESNTLIVFQEEIHNIVNEIILAITEWFNDNQYNEEFYDKYYSNGLYNHHASCDDKIIETSYKSKDGYNISIGIMFNANWEQYSYYTNGRFNPKDGGKIIWNSIDISDLEINIENNFILNSKTMPSAYNKLMQELIPKLNKEFEIG